MGRGRQLWLWFSGIGYRMDKTQNYGLSGPGQWTVYRPPDTMSGTSETKHQRSCLKPRAHAREQPHVKVGRSLSAYRDGHVGTHARDRYTDGAQRPGHSHKHAHHMRRQQTHYSTRLQHFFAPLAHQSHLQGRHTAHKSRAIPSRPADLREAWGRQQISNAAAAAPRGAHCAVRRRLAAAPVRAGHRRSHTSAQISGGKPR